MTVEQHIEGLKGIKPYLQMKMREINFEGMGEKDAEEIGETINAAIEALEKQIPQKPYKVTKLLYHCTKCGTLISTLDKPKDNFCSHCGQKIDWSEGK